MQTVVELPEAELKALDLLSERKQVSRDDLVREAVTVYLTMQQDALQNSFGIWSDMAEDGVEYQQRLRAEWQ